MSGLRTQLPAERCAAAIERLRKLVALQLLCAAEIDPQRYLDHIKFLASEEMKGRGSGTPELEKAAEYIARQFKAIGLQPVDGQSYFQPFEVATNARLSKAGATALAGAVASWSRRG